MDSTGMMKMATGDGFPLRQGAGTGSREVFGGYRGLRRRNSRSRLCSGSFRVCRYIWVQGVRRRSYGGPMRQGGAPGGWARPPPSWTPRQPCSVVLKSPVRILLQKYRSRRFHSVWTPFDIHFLRNTEIGKKNSNSSWPPVSRLVQKMI